MVGPDRAGRILIDAPDAIPRQSVVGGEGGKASLAIPGHAAVDGPGPQIARARFTQREDPAARHARGFALAEDRETYSVETGEAVVGRQPQISVARLTQRTDRVRRQAIRGGPGIKLKRRQLIGSLEPDGERQQHEETRDPAAHADILSAVRPGIRTLPTIDLAVRVLTTLVRSFCPSRAFTVRQRPCCAIYTAEHIMSVRTTGGRT